MLRYSYCTPDYILGSWMLDPRIDYAAINTQNRWQGATFATEPNSRVFPQCVGLRNGKTYNQHVAVQHLNVMIVQKNRVKSKQVGASRVFFARGMRQRLVERGGWLFLEEGNARLAVRVVSRDGADSGDKGCSWDGDWLTADDDLAPIVFVAGRRSRFESSGQFTAHVLEHSCQVKDNALSYAFQDAEGGRANLKLYLDGRRLPEVNGRPIDVAPQRVYDSPHLTSAHRSGVVTIQKSPRRMQLDFNRNEIAAQRF
jgi:hypothetical protein